MIFQDKIKKDEEKGGDNKFRGIHEGKVTEEDIEGVHGSTSSKDTVFDNQGCWCECVCRCRNSSEDISLAGVFSCLTLMLVYRN